MTQENMLMAIWAFSLLSFAREAFGRDDPDAKLRFTIIAIAAAVGWVFL